MNDTVSIHGVAKDRLLDFRALQVDDVALQGFQADTAGALVGQKIAARYGWKTGNHVTLDQLRGFRFNIHGIFTAQGSMDDYLIYVGRKYLQESEDKQGLSHHALVKLKPGADPDEVGQAIAALPLTIQTTAQPERAMLAAVLDQLADLVSAGRLVILLVLAVILIAMGNAVAMATRDRKPEFGILRTLGYRRGMILGMVLTEGLLLAIIGAAAGCTIVQVLVSGGFVKAVSTCGVSLSLTVGPEAWAAGMGAIVSAALLGSVIPAWNASRVDVVDAIGSSD
jgi:putative ABC transport system permease protein